MKRERNETNKQVKISVFIPDKIVKVKAKNVSKIKLDKSKILKSIAVAAGAVTMAGVVTVIADDDKEVGQKDNLVKNTGLVKNISDFYEPSLQVQALQAQSASASTTSQNFDGSKITTTEAFNELKYPPLFSGSSDLKSWFQLAADQTTDWEITSVNNWEYNSSTADTITYNVDITVHSKTDPNISDVTITRNLVFDANYYNNVVKPIADNLITKFAESPTGSNLTLKTFLFNFGDEQIEIIKNTLTNDSSRGAFSAIYKELIEDYLKQDFAKELQLNSEQQVVWEQYIEKVVNLNSDNLNYTDDPHLDWQNNPGVEAWYGAKFDWGSALLIENHNGLVSKFSFWNGFLDKHYIDSETNFITADYSQHVLPTIGIDTFSIFKVVAKSFLKWNNTNNWPLYKLDSIKDIDNIDWGKYKGKDIVAPSVASSVTNNSNLDSTLWNNFWNSVGVNNKLYLPKDTDDYYLSFHIKEGKVVSGIGGSVIFEVCYISKTDPNDKVVITVLNENSEIHLQINDFDDSNLETTVLEGVLDENNLKNWFKLSDDKSDLEIQSFKNYKFKGTSSDGKNDLYSVTLKIVSKSDPNFSVEVQHEFKLDNTYYNQVTKPIADKLFAKFGYTNSDGTLNLKSFQFYFSDEQTQNIMDALANDSSSTSFTNAYFQAIKDYFTNDLAKELQLTSDQEIAWQNYINNKMQQMDSDHYVYDEHVDWQNLTVGGYDSIKGRESGLVTSNWDWGSAVLRNTPYTTVYFNFFDGFLNSRYVDEEQNSSQFDFSQSYVPTINIHSFKNFKLVTKSFLQYNNTGSYPLYKLNSIEDIENVDWFQYKGKDIVAPSVASSVTNNSNLDSTLWNNFWNSVGVDNKLYLPEDTDDYYLSFHIKDVKANADGKLQLTIDIRYISKTDSSDFSSNLGDSTINFHVNTNENGIISFVSQNIPLDNSDVKLSDNIPDIVDLNVDEATLKSWVELTDDKKGFFTVDEVKEFKFLKKNSNGNEIYSASFTFKNKNDQTDLRTFTVEFNFKSSQLGSNSFETTSEFQSHSAYPEVSDWNVDITDDLNSLHPSDADLLRYVKLTDKAAQSWDITHVSDFKYVGFDSTTGKEKYTIKLETQSKVGGQIKETVYELFFDQTLERAIIDPIVLAMVNHYGSEMVTPKITLGKNFLTKSNAEKLTYLTTQFDQAIENEANQLGLNDDQKEVYKKVFGIQANNLSIDDIYFSQASPFNTISELNHGNDYYWSLLFKVDNSSGKNKAFNLFLEEIGKKGGLSTLKTDSNFDNSLVFEVTFDDDAQQSFNSLKALQSFVNSSVNINGINKNVQGNTSKWTNSDLINDYDKIDWRLFNNQSIKDTDSEAKYFDAQDNIDYSNADFHVEYYVSTSTNNQNQLEVSITQRYVSDSDSNDYVELYSPVIFFVSEQQIKKFTDSYFAEILDWKNGQQSENSFKEKLLELYQNQENLNNSTIIIDDFFDLSITAGNNVDVAFYNDLIANSSISFETLPDLRLDATGKLVQEFTIKVQFNDTSSDPKHGFASYTFEKSFSVSWLLNEVLTDTNLQDIETFGTLPSQAQVTLSEDTLNDIIEKYLQKALPTISSKLDFTQINSANLLTLIDDWNYQTGNANLTLKGNQEFQIGNVTLKLPKDIKLEFTSVDYQAFTNGLSNFQLDATSSFKDEDFQDSDSLTLGQNQDLSNTSAVVTIPSGYQLENLKYSAFVNGDNILGYLEGDIVKTINGIKYTEHFKSADFTFVNGHRALSHSQKLQDWVTNGYSNGQVLDVPNYEVPATGDPVNYLESQLNFSISKDWNVSDLQYKFNSDKTEVTVSAKLTSVFDSSISGDVDFKFQLTDQLSVNQYQQSLQNFALSFDNQTKSNFNDIFAHQNLDDLLKHFSQVIDAIDQNGNIVFSSQAEQFFSSLNLRIDNFNNKLNYDVSNADFSMVKTGADSFKIQAKMKVSAVLPSGKTWNQDITIDSEDVVLNYSFNYLDLQYQIWSHDANSLTNSSSANFGTIDDQAVTILGNGNFDANNFPSFLSQQFNFTFNLPDDLEQPTWTFSLNKSTKNQFAEFQFVNSHNHVETLRIYFDSNKSFNQILIDNYSNNDNFGFEENSNFNDFMPLNNPFDASNSNPIDPQQAIKALKNPAVFDDYEIRSVDDWQIQGDLETSTSATVTLHLKLKSNPQNNALLQDPQAQEKTITGVVLNYQRSATEWMNFLLSNYDDTNNQVDSLVSLDENSVETIWNQLNSQISDPHISLQIQFDNNKPNSSVEKHFLVTYIATVTTADGSTVQEHKNVSWNFDLNHNSTEYLNHAIQQATLNLKTNQQSQNYLQWNNLGDPQNYLDTQNLDKNIIVTNAVFHQPTANDDHSAKVTVTFSYVDDNGTIPANAVTITKNYDVDVQNSIDKLLLNQFVETWNNGSPDTTIDVTDNNYDYPTNQSHVSDWIDYLDQFGVLSNQQISLQETIDNFNQVYQNQGAIDIQFDYQYDDLSSKNATLTFNLKFGSESTRVVYALEYPRSFNQYVTEDVLNIAGLKVSDDFLNLDNLSEQDILDRIQNGPAISDLTANDLQSLNNVTFQVVQYVPPQGDETSAHYRVEITYKNDASLHQEINLNFDFSTSYNQFLTDQLPATAQLESRGNANHQINEDLSSLNLNSNNPFANFFEQNSDFLQANIHFSNVKLEKSPNISNEDFAFQFSADVSIGNATAKKIVFNASLDETSQYFADLMWGEIDLKADANLINNEDANFRSQDQTFQLNDSDFSNFFTFANSHQEDLFKKYFSVDGGFILHKLDSNSKDTTLSFNLHLSNGDLDLGNRSIAVHYTETLDEISLRNVPDEIANYATTSGIDELWNNTTNTPSASEVDQIKNFLTQNGVEEQGLTEVQFKNGSINSAVIDQTTDHFYLQQTAVFTVFYGQTSKDITLHFFVNPNSDDYIQHLLQSDFFTFGVSQSFKSGDDWDSQMQNEDIQVYLNNQNISIDNLLNYGTPNSTTNHHPQINISLSNLPSQDSTQATATIRVNQNSQKQINFDFTTTPNQKALEEAFAGKGSAILPNEDFVTSQIPNAFTLGKQGTDNNDVIGESIPSNDLLGFDNQNQISDLAKLTQWLESNTDLDLHSFATSLANNSNVQIDQVHITSVEYNQNDKNADQVLKITFKSGQSEKTISFKLHFEKSVYQVQREQGIQSWTQDVVFQPGFFNTNDFHTPVITDANDFKISDLQNQHYSIAGVKDYVSPVGDSQNGSITVLIVDNDPIANHNPQELKLTLNFDKSPNQVKTDQLVSQYDSVDKALEFQFDDFTTSPDIQSAFLQNLPWPSQFGIPDISQISLESNNSFEEVFKVSVSFGATSPKDIYLKGSLNHYTKLYLENAAKDSTLGIDSNILDSLTEHKVGDLTTQELLNSNVTFKVLPSDTQNQQIKQSSNKQGQLWIDDILVKGITITSADPDFKDGKAQVVFSITDPQTNHEITFTKEYDIQFKYDQQSVNLNAFLENVVSNQKLNLNANTDITSPPTSNQNIGDWLSRNTNLPSFEQQWNLPANASISSANFRIDPTSKTQTLEVVYVNGPYSSPPLTFYLDFDKSPNQAELDNFDQNTLLHLDDNYLQQTFYDALTQPGNNDFVLNVNYQISSADDAISNYIPPTDDSSAGTIQVKVVNKNDHSAVRTITVNVDFAHSANYYRSERLKSYSDFELNPYLTNLPTNSEITQSNAVFEHAQISNIQTDSSPNPNAAYAYTADVKFGNEPTITVKFYRPENPLKQLLNDAVSNYTFDVSDAVKNLPEYSGSSNFDFNNLFNDFVIRDKTGNEITDLPANVTTDKDSFVYTPPLNDDSIESHFEFDLVYNGEVATWTKTVNGVTQTLVGSTDPNSPGYLGDQGFIKVANSETPKAVTKHVAFDFRFANSNNFYYLQEYIQNLQVDVGAAGTTGFENLISGFPPADVNGDIQAKKDWLTQNTNFVTPDSQSQINITDFIYSQNTSSSIARVSLIISKGNTQQALEIKLHFSLSYNQDQLNNKSIDDLISGINGDYLKVAHKDIDNLTEQLFGVNSPYVIFDNTTSGVHDFVGVSDDDSHTGSVKLWIRNQNDVNVVREITVPLTFDQSINEVKLDQIASQNRYELDSFWQSENNPFPTESNALKLAILQLLTEDAQIVAQLQDQNVRIDNLQALDAATAKLLNVNGKVWTVSVSVGNAGPTTIYLWQKTNPLKTNFDQILKDLNWDVDGSITDAWNHSHTSPTLSDITFSKQSQPFSLPDDINSADGKMTFQITGVDLPQGSDDKTATIHFNATFQLKNKDGVVHEYIQKDLTTTFDYLFSENGIKIQTAFYSLGVVTNDHVDLGTDQKRLGKIAPDQMSVEDFLDLLTNSNYNLAQSLQDLNIPESALSLTYGSSQTRDNSSANQVANFQITLGTSTYNLKLTLHFDKSYNQDLLDQKTVDELFGTDSNRGIDASYSQVTKSEAPNITDMHLQDSRYQVIGVDHNSYQTPDIVNNKKTAQVTVTIQDTLDSNVTRDIVLTFEFDTIGLDVSQYSKADGEYSSTGNIVLPDGSVYNFTSNDPTINGFSTIDITNFYDQNGSPLNLPQHTKLEYQVLDNRTLQVIQTWSDQAPTNLLNGEVVQVRIVSNDPNYSIQNSQTITLDDITDLVIGVSIPSDFVWTTATYHGNEGHGKISIDEMSNYIVNLHTQQENQENQNVHYVFTVTRNNNIIHDHQLESALDNLQVGDHVTVNIVVNDGSTHFLLNTPNEYALPDVNGLTIAPDVSIDDLELLTNQPDGSKGHDGFANANLKISDSATIQAKQRGAFPNSDNHWEWSYQVVDANDNIISPASNTLPTNLKNGQTVIVSYQARTGYTLPDSYKQLTKTFDVQGLLYEITLPNDIAPTLPNYLGYEGSGKFNTVNNNSDRFSASQNFENQDHIIVEYRVENANGDLKIDWTSSDNIQGLNVHDRVYARYVVDDEDNYILINPLNDVDGVFVNEVTNLLITPRVKPSDLSAGTQGVRNHATILLFDESNSHALAKLNNQDNWHWEYQVTNSADGSIIDDWSTNVPVALDNGYTVKVRVAANPDFQLDANYSIFSFDIKKLKLEIDVSTLETPQVDFDGFLNEGTIASMQNTQGQTYQIPNNTTWEFYVEKTFVSAEQLQNDLNNPTAWTTWDGTDLSAGPQNLNVGDLIYFRLKVTDEDDYVLSNSFEPPAIKVRGLEINPDNIRAHYYPEIFEGEGNVRIDYHDPSVQYSPEKPFVQNLEEKVVNWEIRVERSDGTVDDWQDYKNVTDLKNGDHVYLRSEPINGDYLMSNSIENDFVVHHLLIKIDSTHLTLHEFVKFYNEADDIKTVADNVGQLIDGEAGLAPAQVWENKKEVTDQLPTHVTLKYKYIPAEQAKVDFDDPQVSILDAPPDHGLSNGDRIMIYLSTDDPDVYRLNQNVVRVITVKGLSPIPPMDLQPEFDYNNHADLPGIDGEGFGNTNPSSQLIENFHWEYLVLDADYDVPASLDNVNQLSGWTTSTPDNLSNGDRVFYRLAPEDSFNVVKPGTHIDPISQKEVRNDYLTDPVVVSGLKRLVDVDTQKLADLELEFTGNNTTGYIKDMQNPESVINNMLQQSNHSYFKYVFYVNGTLFDPNQATLKNGDEISIKIVPSDDSFVFSEENVNKLSRNFEISNLIQEKEKKNPTLKIITIIASVVFVVPIIGLGMYRVFRKRLRKHI